MSNSTLVFLREQLFWIEDMLEDLEQHIALTEEADESGYAVRSVVVLRQLQMHTRSLLNAFTVAANSAAFLN